MSKLDSKNSERLLEALKQNWEHARHQELQRQHQLYVFMAVFGGILAFVFNEHVAWHLTLMTYWPVFLFLMLFSLLVSHNVTKWNLEFMNHTRNIQWICEKLELIKPISQKRKDEVGSSTLEGNKESLLDDSMFQGYVGLPLPLPKRVRQNFENMVDVLLGGTAIAFAMGILIASTVFSLLLQSNVTDVISLSQTLAYVSGGIFGILVVILNRRVRSRMKANAKILLNVRKPDDLPVGLKYRGEKPFFKDKSKRHKYHT